MTYIPKGYYVDVKDWDQQDINILAVATAQYHGCGMDDLSVTYGKIVWHSDTDDYRYLVLDENFDGSTVVWVANLEQVEGKLELRL